ncbi:MAG: hypothetical protein AB7L36_10460, partial [Sphingomonadaceae bacterium]
MTFDARSPQAVSPAFLALGCVGFLTSAPALAQTEATAANTQRLGGVTVEATAIEDSLRVDRV